jgi:Zn-dependent protease with chaperone function
MRDRNADAAGAVAYFMQPVLVLLPNLAQAGQNSSQRSGDASAVVAWIAVLIGVVLAGGLVMMWLRRRIFMADASAHQAGGLMESLRKMRESGQMSQEEYDATRKAMAARLAKADTGPTSPRTETGRAQSR